MKTTSWSSERTTKALNGIQERGVQIRSYWLNDHTETEEIMSGIVPVEWAEKEPHSCLTGIKDGRLKWTVCITTRNHNTDCTKS